VAITAATGRIVTRFPSPTSYAYLAARPLSATNFRTFAPSAGLLFYTCIVEETRCASDAKLMKARRTRCVPGFSFLSNFKFFTQVKTETQRYLSTA
jgi:hypothetical protein